MAAFASLSLCNDTTEAIEFYEPQGLFLKPIARVVVSVSLPHTKVLMGKSISNWEVMEKIKRMVRPENFTVLRIAKSSLEFVRFEGEVETRKLVKAVVAKLDSKTIKLTGFPDVLRVNAAESKVSYPTRHDWDSFFRDAENMNENKPGERPDTIHFEYLPCRWFAGKESPDGRPSELVVRSVMQQFGAIRNIDVPILDPYRREMQLPAGGSNNFQTFSSFAGSNLYFDAYIQFADYTGFLKAMNAFKGMKLMFKSEDGKTYASNIKVDFDRTKHLSDENIRKQKMERDKLIGLEKEREERIRKQREEEERKLEEERRQREDEERERDRKRHEKLNRREERRQDREEKRRQKQKEKRRQRQEEHFQKKIALEERKILIAQRKLQSVRLMTELLERVKVQKQKEEVERHLAELEAERKRQLELERLRQEEMDRKRRKEEEKKVQEMQTKEEELRAKLTKKVKLKKLEEEDQVRESKRREMAGRALKSAVVSAK